MEDTIIHIKNMVCGRCIQSVTNILELLKIAYKQISLGEIIVDHPLNPKEAEQLKKELQQVGFELVADKNEKLVNRIKSIIIKGIYEENSFNNKNLSVVLREQLFFDYSHLSSLFSKTEGKSIQQFQQDVKIERVKELLEYNEISIAEIAADLGYSSAAYLSTQFKKSTGHTPSQYRSNHLKTRNALDEV